MKILLAPDKHKGVLDSPTSTHLWKHYVVNCTAKTVGLLFVTSILCRSPTLAEKL